MGWVTGEPCDPRPPVTPPLLGFRREVPVNRTLILALLFGCHRDDERAAAIPDGFVGASEVIGPDGGSLALPDGSRLTIPEGALDEEVAVSVATPEDDGVDPGYRLWVFEPDGLEFNRPVAFEFPLPEGADGLLVDEVPALSVFHVGAANGETDIGSEVSLYDVADVEVGATTATASLDHFSVVEAMAEIDAIAYIVTDIPPEYLRAGDIYFTLTKMGIGVWQNEKDGPNWAPGHVGVLAPSLSNPARLIEATPPSVLVSTVGEFRTDPGHLTLGPHRPGAWLTPDETTAAMSWLEGAVGSDYNSIFGHGVLGYSCVGLAEEMLDAAGRGQVPWDDEVEGVTAPLTLFRRTLPVRKFSVVAGEFVEVPIWGVRVDDASFKPSETPPWEYYCACSYAIAASALPANATFRDGVPVITGNVGGEGYQFEWQTWNSDAGTTVSIPLEMTFDVVLTGGVTVPIRKVDSLQIEVLPWNGPTAAAVVLTQTLVLGDLTYPAGTALDPTRIVGGHVSGPDGGCDHDHLHGPSITIDGAGPIPDPDPNGCGYGRYVEDHPAYLVD